MAAANCTRTTLSLHNLVTVDWQSVTIFGAQSSRSAGGALVVDATRGVADAGMVGAIVAAGLLPHARNLSIGHCKQMLPIQKTFEIK